MSRPSFILSRGVVTLTSSPQLSNEFKFHISAIHHAHEAYLVIPLLEKFYGGKPAVAMFATNARYVSTQRSFASLLYLQLRTSGTSKRLTGGPNSLQRF